MSHMNSTDSCTLNPELHRTQFPLHKHSYTSHSVGCRKSLQDLSPVIYCPLYLKKGTAEKLYTITLHDLPKATQSLCVTKQQSHEKKNTEDRNTDTYENNQLKLVSSISLTNIKGCGLTDSKRTTLGGDGVSSAAVVANQRVGGSSPGAARAASAGPQPYLL